MIREKVDIYMHSVDLRGVISKRTVIWRGTSFFCFKCDPLCTLRNVPGDREVSLCICNVNEDFDGCGAGLG